MRTLWQDIHYALRLMARNPGYAIVAVLTLALGIGATTAIFSVVNGVLIRPLPYPQPEQLVRVYESTARFPKFPMSPGNFLDYRERNTVFSDLAIYTREDVDLAEGDRPERLSAMRVSAEFFRLLGFQPALGRDFRRAEEQPGEGRVAIISHALWQRRFGGDPQTVGRTVNLSGRPFTIIGVLPPGVQHVGGDYRTLAHGESVDLWWPVDLSKERAVRFAHFMNAVGRMKAGVTAEAADAEMNILAGQLAEQFPNTNRNWRTRVSTLYEELVGKSRRMLLVLVGAVAFVLLIVCVNVASLCLARASARAHEMAVRAAVGAGRGRLIRQLLTENLLTALVGGVLGVLFALWLIDLIVAFGPKDLPRRQMIELDAYMLVFVLGVSLLTGLLFGVAPALHGTRLNLNDMLKDGGRLLGGASRQQRLRSALVVVEVALALVLLIGAGLLGRSFVRLQRVESGFRPNGVVTMSIAPPFARYQTPQAVVAFYDRLMERLQALPGVTSVGATSDLPWTGYDENLSFNIEGKTFAQDQTPGARYHFVSPDYFRTIGTALVAGRYFDARDRMGAQQVILINEIAARRYWPGESAVGRRITFTSQPKKAEDWMTVAGVVGDVKDTPGADEAAPALYWPLAQQTQREMILALRGTVDPTNLVESVRREVAAIDKELAIADVRQLDEIAGAALSRERFALLLIGLFAGAAMLLAGIGIYGVMSYVVAQRRREIGIRLALGAQRVDVLKLVLGQGAALIGAGLALGAGTAAGLVRLMRSLLYATSPYDPWTFAAVAALLAGVALAACYIPARRAMKVDPMIALRYE